MFANFFSKYSKIPGFKADFVPVTSLEPEKNLKVLQTKSENIASAGKNVSRQKFISGRRK